MKARPRAEHSIIKRDDFAIARDIVQANQLGSDLKNFSIAPGMFMLIAEHGRSIGQISTAASRP